MQHTFLDHCFVCGARFVTANPPGTANEERHHVVPRAYGGTDGPQVSLCDGCHSKVHKLSMMLEVGRVDSTLLQSLTKESQQRLTYLATVIYNAKKATENDPNKMLPVTFKITKGEALKIDTLKRILNVNSRRDVYSIALERLYNSLCHK